MSFSGFQCLVAGAQPADPDNALGAQSLRRRVKSGASWRVHAIGAGTRGNARIAVRLQQQGRAVRLNLRPEVFHQFNDRRRLFCREPQQQRSAFASGEGLFEGRRELRLIIDDRRDQKQLRPHQEPAVSE